MTDVGGNVGDEPYSGLGDTRRRKACGYATAKSPDATT